MIEASRPIEPVLVQRRPAARVEDRVVLEHDHRRLDRGERVPARGEHGVPGRDRPLDALARPAMRVLGPAARSSVHHDRDVHGAKDKGVRPL